MSRVLRIQSRICVGGPALHSILLSEGLSYRRGARYDTTLVGGALEPGERSLEPLARSREVPVEIIPEMRRAVRPSLDVRAIQKTVALIRRLRPSVVHTHTAKAGAVGRVAARMAGAPVVVHTFHGHVFEGYFSGPKSHVFIALERALSRVSDCILTVSEQLRNDLAFKFRVAPFEKIRVVPLGLELDRFRTIDPHDCDRGAFRRALGIARDAPLVVAVGRLVAIKRFDHLIRAFERVLERFPAAVLAIAGDGEPSLRVDLERLARPLGARVRFLGWRHDVDAIYRDADVLALTSDNEGTPVAVIEAIASGLPVVATDVGGVRDVLRPDMGFLVERGDVSAVGDAVVRTLERRARLPEPLRDDIVRRFSHRRLIGDVASLYDDLLEKKVSLGWSRPEGLRGGARC